MISILAPARSWPEGNSEDTDSDGDDDDACDYDDDDEIKMKCFESIPGQAYRRGEKKKRFLMAQRFFFTVKTPLSENETTLRRQQRQRWEGEGREKCHHH